MLIQSTAGLTKALRDKKTPLLDLLPSAQTFLHNRVPTYFPGKEVWLVEWLVKRLDEPSSLDGRLSPEVWDFLYELLTSPLLNFNTAAATLKKHKFVGILARTLSDAVARTKSNDDKSTTDNVEMRNGAGATSPTSSSATEPGSPLVRMAFGRQGDSSRLERGNQIRQSQQIRALLVPIFKVVEFLRFRYERNRGGADEGSKRRRLDVTTPVLKHSPEAATTLVESFLKLLDIIVQGLGYVEEASEWAHSCLLIWKTCSHGVSNTDKLVYLVSERLMCPIAKLLSLQPLPSDIRDLAAWFLGTHIFQEAFTWNGTPHEFLEISQSLASACTGKDTTSIDSQSALHSLPVILELAIEKADRDYHSTQRRQAGGFVSVLLSWMLSIADTHNSIQKQLLDIAIRRKVAVESGVLKDLVHSALRIPDSTDWKLLQAVVIIDFDIVLSIAERTIFSKLSEYDIHDCDEDVWEFVEQIVIASVEGRDLHFLVERWLNLLASTKETQLNIWRSDRFQSMVSIYTETALTQNQILDILQACVSSTAGWSCSVVIDGILRGVNRIETIDALNTSGINTSLFNQLAKFTLGSGLRARWQCLRALLRILELWPTMEVTFLRSLKDHVAHQTKMMLANVGNLSEDAVKELSLLLTMAFVLRERSLLSSEDLDRVLSEFIKILPKVSNSHASTSWDGSFDKMSTCEDYVSASLYMLTERFIPIISQIGRPLLQQFIAGFFAAASRTDASEGSVNVWSAWCAFVKADSSVYDDLIIKDLLFNGIIAVVRSPAATRDHISPVVEMLSQCPLSALRKSQREAFSDILFEYAKNANDTTEKAKLFGVLNRLARLSTNSSALAMSSGSRDGLYRLFTQMTDLEHEAEISLATSVIRHLAESRHDEKAMKQLASAIDLAIESVDRSCASAVAPQAWAYCILQGSLESQNETAVKSKLDALISKIPNLLTRNLLATLAQWNQIDNLSLKTMDLKLLEVFVSGAPDQSIISGIRNRIEPLLVKLDWHLLGPGENTDRHTSQRVVFFGRLVCAISMDDGKEATDIALFLCQEGYYNEFQQSYAASISRLGTTSLRGLIEYMTDVLFPHSRRSSSPFSHRSSFPLRRRTSSTSYVILRDILASASSTSLNDPQMESQMSLLLSQIIIATKSCDDFDTLCILLDIINMLLKDKGLSVSQSTVEKLIAGVIVIASRFGPQFDYPEANTDATFIPLCSILANILSSQRLRVRGRHGLFVFALESLMTLLFLPKAVGRRKTDTKIHPPWLSSVKSWTVTKEAATAYCRLLTMLCNPSTSSVRLNHRADALSSATVAAKKALEPHLPSLLDKYISLSLTSQVTPEVKVALKTGVYAMFNVMEASTLRSFNMGLDNPGRVIFKQVYDDWSRYGKWMT
ncbi:hypothetical protein ABW21_db0204929 [Orbilia brochopaga]|nr:hypothetical protein ABW21_db0204929 [Drechslerella brochopaga]